MIKKPLLAFVTLCSLSLLHAEDLGSQLTAYDLRCSDRNNPSGITSYHPVLTWKLASPVRGDAQSTWHLLAASSADLLAKDQGDLWDSGRVTSTLTSASYQGKPLESSQRTYWKIKVGDAKGAESGWSKNAMWLTGVMKPSDWGYAKWITESLNSTNAAASTGNESSIRFIKEVVVKPGLSHAIIHVTGLGQFRLEVNGVDCTPSLLTPGWTESSKTILYDTIDLSDDLKSGTNCVMITLGSGMYRNPPSERYAKYYTEPRLLKCFGVLDLAYLDGSKEKIPTDRSWGCTRSPITYSSIYGGEDHDARIGLNPFESSLEKAINLPQSLIPTGLLKGADHAGPPITQHVILQPVSTNRISSNSFVIDLGQNVSMMPQISVQGAAGSSVKITPSELIGSHGDIEDPMCGGKSFCTYTLAGTGTETWKPNFYYKGARYLRIDLSPAKPDGPLPQVMQVEGIVVHNSAQPTGRFACSNDLFNRIYALVRWAQRSNMMSVLTDCPTREKLGWLEEDHLNGPALRYNFDLNTLFSKICGDMSDAQTPEGLVPDIAPEYTIFGGGFRDSPEWGSACLLVPWQQYEFTGDPSLLKERYNSMKRYVEYLVCKSKDGIVDYGLGDWYDIGPQSPGQAQLTPKALTATAFLWQDADILSKTAYILGRKDDVVKYGELAKHTKESFNNKFFDPVTANYSSGSQCANAIPLVMGLVPEEKRSAVLENLVKDVQTKGLTAGDVGYRYLLRALADGGRSDVVFALNNQSDKLGYGMQLVKGATSLTEAWDAGHGSSQNHFMLGQINEWFFRNLAGIQIDPEKPGFAHIVIHPTPEGKLTWAGADYDSIHGRISSWWKRSGNEFTLDVSIPPGCTASVFLPTNDAKSIKEGVTLQNEFQLKERISPGGICSIEIPSGTYHFTCSTL